MLYLKKPGEDLLEEHFKRFKDGVIKNIKSAKINDKAKFFLLKNLREILISEPSELLVWHTSFFTVLNKAPLTKLNYQKILIIQSKKNSERTPREKKELKNYLISFKKLEKIFDYESFMSQSKSKSYAFAKELEMITCTYCNRLYSNTIIKIDPITGRENNGSRITRPVFDHWFPKSKYPILALSYYNLIPSCSVCNSSIKGDTSFSLDTHLHPYIRKPDTDFKFSYKKDSYDKDVVSIKDFDALNIITKNTINDFRIVDVYDAHSDTELKELIDLRLKYTDNYLDTLFNKTFNLDMKEEEIYRYVFGIEIQQENYHKRPFSKFKHDIIQELKNIK